ncbi:MAG: copper chaperone PCu(A)C [Caulobacteraceae bacterium]|nr:copper chaperone PCu(A)C [Caulobacteraceae bacterium]
MKTALLAALALAACAPAARAAPVEVVSAWCRPAGAGAPTAACYVTLKAAAADRLTTVASPLAGKVEVHDMSMAGGIMRMRHMTEGLPLPAGETVRMGPGGKHLMLIGPKGALTVGGKLPLTLTFQKAPAQTVTAHIVPQLPQQPQGYAPQGSR